jgi:hypothetical protein
MTRFQAIYVKYCRVRLECSWREIHSRYQKRYEDYSKWWINPVLQKHRDEWVLKTLDEESKAKIIKIFDEHPHGNQISGRELCRQAQTLLKENWDDEC